MKAIQLLLAVVLSAHVSEKFAAAAAPPESAAAPTWPRQRSVRIKDAPDSVLCRETQRAITELRDTPDGLIARLQDPRTSCRGKDYLFIEGNGDRHGKDLVAELVPAVGIETRCYF